METSALMGKNVAQLIVDDFAEMLGVVKSADKNTEKVMEEL
jgi:hypothetical protein